MESSKKLPLDINGNIINIQTTDYEDLSILQLGYIITPQGFFIKIDNNKDHNAVIANYVKTYLGLDEEKHYNSTEGILELCSINHIAYYGPGSSAANRDFCSNSMGFGWLFFPSPITNITYNQRIAIRELLKTNVSHFSDNKIVDVSYGEVATNIQYTDSDIMSLITDEKVRS